MHRQASVRSYSPFRLSPLALAAAMYASPAWSQDQAAPAPPPRAASAPAPATAASTASPAAPAAQSPDKELVQTVVVTANRRRERARDVAGSVSVQSGTDLQRRGATSLQDVAGFVPGLTVSGEADGLKRASIRGITTGSLQIGSSVAVYLDESPISLSSSIVGGAALSPDIDPLDVERIEVLKGPQGSLYGASALGGLIKYVTIAPDLKSLEGRVEVGVSKIDHGGSGHSLRGAVNVPLIKDLLAMRVTAYDRQDPGYIDDTLRNLKDINKSTNRGVRWSSLLKPSAAFDARLTLDTQELKTADSSAPQYDAATLAPRYGDYGVQNRFAQPVDNKYDRAALTLNYDLGFASLLSVSSWMKMRNNLVLDGSNLFGFVDSVTAAAYARLGFPVAPVGVTGARGVATLTTTKKVQEFRLTSPSGGRFDWLAGVFWQQEATDYPAHYDVYSGTNFTTPAVADYSRSDTYADLHELSAYVNGTLRITDTFDVQAGVRYADVRQDYAVRRQQGFNYFTRGPSLSPANQEQSKQSPSTWMLSPRWRLGADNMVYARAATGYRPGGPNVPGPIGTPAAPPVKSDSIINYEVGWKGAWPAAGVDMAASLFRIDWKGIQVSAIDSATGYVYYTNGGKAHTQGLEYEGGWRPVNALRLSGTLTAMQAKLDQDVAAVSGKRGDDIPYTPKLSGALSADYSLDAGSGQVSIGASWRYTGKERPTFTSQSGTPFAPGMATPALPAYQLLDLRASYVFDRWTLGLLVKNALDKRAPINFSGNSVIPNMTTGVLAPASVAVTAPRSISVTLGADF
jgi:iron complex outermembrane recepter protein